jgi:membrane-bound metal-dependent hydrolase YbcI (DUF457 family)
MATPLGHVLAGQIAFRAATGAGPDASVRLGLLCAFASVAPDLDFVPGLLLGAPARYHQGVSHSFAMAILVATLLAGVHAWKGGRFGPAWIALFLAAASHLVLDLFGPDRRTPYGIPLFWPFDSGTYLSPITLLPGVSHAGSTDVPTGDWLARTFRPRNLRAALIEAMVLVPAVLAAEVLVRRRRVRAGGAK